MTDIETLKGEIELYTKKLTQYTTLLSSYENLKTIIDIREQDPTLFTEIIKELKTKNEMSEEFKTMINSLDIINKVSNAPEINISSGKFTLNTDDVYAFLFGVYLKNPQDDKTIENFIKNSLIFFIKEFEQSKNKVQTELNKKEIELIGLSDGNPLVGMQFGNSTEVANLFKEDPANMTKRISNLIVDMVKEAKKSNQTGKKGDLNWKKTMNSAMKNEGIPYELKFRNKAIAKQGVKPKIFLIMDVSGSCSAFNPLVISMGYAFFYILQEYEVVIYSAASIEELQSTAKTSELNKVYPGTRNVVEMNLKGYIEGIKIAEKKNIQGSYIPRNLSMISYANRISKDTLKANSKTPEVLSSMLNSRNVGGYNGDSCPAMVLAIAESAPENSVFIVFTDYGPRNSSLLINYLKNTKYCNKLKSFENNIFFVNPYDTYGETFIYVNSMLCAHTSDVDFVYKNGESSLYQYKYEIDNTFVKPCSKFKIDDSHFYPTKQQPVDYNEWLRDIIKMIKNSLV